MPDAPIVGAAYVEIIPVTSDQLATKLQQQIAAGAEAGTAAAGKAVDEAGKDIENKSATLGQKVGAIYDNMGNAAGAGMTKVDKATSDGLDKTAKTVDSKSKGLAGKLAGAFNAVPTGCKVAMDKTGDAFDKGFDSVTTKIGKGFKAVGSSAGANIFPPIQSVTDKIAEQFDKAGDHEASWASRVGALGNLAAASLATGAVAIGAAGIKMAEDFDASMTELVTGAGESQSNLKLVSDGILAMAPQVGQTADALAKGMYLIESAGFHGASGLSILKASAEGAAVGGADLATMSNAVTTALHDYGLQGSQATNVTSALVETVAVGKTHMEDLAGSLGRVLPNAAALGISFPQVAGAMSTMTNAGLNARFASQHLQNTLLALSAPAATAQKAMSAVGLTSQQVKNTLDKQGLTGALALIEEHVGKTFPSSSVAYVTAMKDIYGGTTGYSTALMLGGKNLATYQDDVNKIGHALGAGGKQVQGFGLVQHDLKFQLDQASAGMQAMGIKIGDFLIPWLQKGIKWGGELTSWALNHKGDMEAIAIAIGTVTAALAAFSIAQKVTKLLQGLVLGYRSLAGAELTADEAAAANPFGLIALAVAGLVVAVVELVKHWKEIWSDIKKWASDAVDFLHTRLGTLLAVLAGPIGWLVLLATHFKQVWGDIKKWTSDFVGDLTHIWDTVEHAVEEAFDKVRAFFEKWWPVLLPLAMTLFLGPLGLVVGVVVDEIILHWHRLVSIIIDAWHTLSGATSSSWGAISSAIMDVVRPLVDFLGQAWNVIYTVATAAWDLLRAYFQVWWDVIKALFTEAINIVTTVLSSAWDIIRGYVEIVWDAIKAYFQVWWTVLETIVTVAWTIVHGIFETFLNLIEGHWSAAWDAIKNTFSTVWSEITGAAKQVWGTIESFFTSSWTTFEGTVKSLWGNIVSGITNAWNGLTGAATKLWSDVKGAFVTGIDDVIRTINTVFVDPLNSALGIIHLKIPSIPLVKAAMGTVFPVGAGGRTSGPVVLAGEGNPAYPEYVIPTDPAHRANALRLTDAMLSRFAAGGVIDTDTIPHLSFGGSIVGGIVSAAKSVGHLASSVGSDLVGGFSTLVSAIRSGAVDAISAAMNAIAGPLESTLAAIPPQVVGEMAKGSMQAIVSDLENWLKGKTPAPGTAGSGVSGPIAPVGGAVSSNNAANQALGMQMAAAYGWGSGPEWTALNNVVMRESGWNSTAQNPTSSAYGIAQNISGLAGYGPGGQNPSVQIAWLLAYIKGRYGDPIAAWAHELSAGWYDAGGFLPTGLSLALNTTGRPEPVGAGGITFTPGSVVVNMQFAGDAPSTAAGMAMMNQQVTAAVTAAISQIADIVDQHTPAQVR